MIMTIKNLPADINAEILLDYYPAHTFNVEFKGLHKRNAYNDILSLEDEGERLQMSLGRNSLYNSLPEFLFHPIDRFDLPHNDRKKRFAEECAKQEDEKENAYNFFAPIDLALLQLKTKVRHSVVCHTSENKVLIDIIADSLSKKQKENRFIKKSLVYLPYCSIIRGDRTLITQMLRKIMMEEGLSVDVCDRTMTFIDHPPRYNMDLGEELSSTYLGTGFEQNVICYNINYWSEEYCDENFSVFIDELEEYRLFVQDFFLSVESILKFDVHNDAPTLRLSDTTTYNYLNYNTNI